MTADSLTYDADHEVSWVKLEGRFTSVSKFVVEDVDGESEEDSLVFLGQYVGGDGRLALTSNWVTTDFAETTDNLFGNPGKSIVAFTLVDLRGDRRPDLVAATSSGELLLLPDLTPTSSLLDARTTELDLPTGVQICDLVAGNFDNDDDLDIAIVLASPDWNLSESTLFATHRQRKTNESRLVVVSDPASEVARERAERSADEGGGCFGAVAIPRPSYAPLPPDRGDPYVQLSSSRHTLLTMDGRIRDAVDEPFAAARRHYFPDEMWSDQMLSELSKPRAWQGTLAPAHFNDELNGRDYRRDELDIALLIWPKPSKKADEVYRACRDCEAQGMVQFDIFQPHRPTPAGIPLVSEQPRALVVGQFGSNRGQQIVVGSADGTIDAYRHERWVVEAFSGRMGSLVTSDRQWRWTSNPPGDGAELLGGLAIGDIDGNGLVDIVASVPDFTSIRLVKFYHPCIDGPRCASQ